MGTRPALIADLGLDACHVGQSRNLVRTCGLALIEKIGVQLAIAIYLATVLPGSADEFGLASVLLRRDGWAENPKRIYRLFNELDLQLRNKTPKWLVMAKLREDKTDATHSNEVWAMDFVHDQLGTGRKLRILSIVDTHSRYAPATDPRFFYRGEDVVQTLVKVCPEVGYPQMIRVANGSEFISRDLDLWAYQRDVILDFSRPCKPTDNGFIEAFNSKLRAECLNAHWFLTLADAREKLEYWRQYYNEDRPHSAIGYKVPSALQDPGGEPSPTP
jgi:putative transposase